jgi:hypothetical protein
MKIQNHIFVAGPTGSLYRAARLFDGGIGGTGVCPPEKYRNLVQPTAGH